MKKKNNIICLNCVFLIIAFFTVSNCRKGPIESPGNTLYTFDLEQLAAENPVHTGLSAKSPWGQTAIQFRPDSKNNGENYNTGLVNICNLPYNELVKAVTETNIRIYKVAAGTHTSFDQKAKLIPAIYF